MHYLLAALLLILPLSSFAQENRGTSWILQMCSEHADCSTIKTAYEGASVLNAGWMYLTSNPDRCKCAPGFLGDPRPKRVRITLCNSTCFRERGRVCQPYECFAGESIKSADQKVRKRDPDIMKRFKRAAALAKQDLKSVRGSLDLAVSPCLECDLSGEARKILLDETKKIFPEAKLVDNPLKDGCLPGYLCEKHGNPTGNANLITDNDGLDYDGIDQLDYWQRNRSSYMALAWKGCNNGLKRGEGFSPPQNRKNYCGASRDGKDFQSANKPNALAISSSLNDADKRGCKKMLPAKDGAKKGFTWKLGDGRNFAVTLFPGNFKNLSRVEIWKDGKVIDRAKYRGTYTHDKSNRLIFDWTKHPGTFPDNAVLHGDGSCWVLEKPQFRID